jgi:hypothetical protein
MVARFTKDKYGWRCIKVWNYIEQNMPVEYFRCVPGRSGVLDLNVSRAPRLGFCRRPHTYI